MFCKQGSAAGSNDTQLFSRRCVASMDIGLGFQCAAIALDG